MLLIKSKEIKIGKSDGLKENQIVDEELVNQYTNESRSWVKSLESSSSHSSSAQVLSLEPSLHLQEDLNVLHNYSELIPELNISLQLPMAPAARTNLNKTSEE